MTRLERLCSNVSRWINRNLWTGHDRPICAEIFAKYISSSHRKCEWWRMAVRIMDRIMEEPNHCRNSWLRWPVKPKRR